MVKILGVVSEYYKHITCDLAMEAMEFLKKSKADFEICYVPGALEIPSAISFAIIGDKNNYDGYIAIGCIIKGETDHYEHVSMGCMRGIVDVSVQHMVPVCSAIVTAHNLADARARSARNAPCNVAKHAAEAILQMVEIYKRFI